MNKENQIFNKVNALDELAEIMKLPDNAKVSETLKAMHNAQDFLKKINDDAFQIGFEIGCDAAKKVEEL